MCIGPRLLSQAAGKHGTQRCACLLAAATSTEHHSVYSLERFELRYSQISFEMLQPPTKKCKQQSLNLATAATKVGSHEISEACTSVVNYEKW